jgi:hypothetical protein
VIPPYSIPGLSPKASQMSGNFAYVVLGLWRSIDEVDLSIYEGSLKDLEISERPLPAFPGRVRPLLFDLQT